MSKLRNQFFRHVGTNKNHNTKDSSTSSSYSLNASNSNNNFNLNKRKGYERNDREGVTTRSERGNRSIRCHECEGFGHFQAECPTFHKKKKKSLIVTLSDDEMTSNSDTEEFGRALISISTEKVISNEDGPNKRKEFDLYCDHQQSSSIVHFSSNDLLKRWEADQIALKQVNERIQVLVEDNHHYQHPLQHSKQS